MIVALFKRTVSAPTLWTSAFLRFSANAVTGTDEDTGMMPTVLRLTLLRPNSSGNLLFENDDDREATGLVSFVDKLNVGT
jgi:hypothetical protein